MSVKAEVEVMFRGGEKTKMQIFDWIAKANSRRLPIGKNGSYCIDIVKKCRDQINLKLFSEMDSNLDWQLQNLYDFLKGLDKVEAMYSTVWVRGEGMSFDKRI